MADVKFRSDILVELDADGTCGSDRLCARRAWVEAPGSESAHDDTEKGHERLLRGCWPETGPAHGTVFEPGRLSVYVEAPVVVWWHMTRHRIASFNLESGRYRELAGEFCVIPEGRKTLEPNGFKPMKPVLEAEEVTWGAATEGQRRIAESAWASYRFQLRSGVAREVARLVLPFTTYYRGYVDMNPRSWLGVFSKRRSGGGSFPQAETEEMVSKVEALFAARWPLLYKVFNDRGRKAP